MKIVVDTNIVFSALLNPVGKIGKILIHSRKHFQFYTCDFLKVELLKHRVKLLKLTRLTSEELNELEFLVTRNIAFINEELIPEETMVATEAVLANIDLNDTPFVSLTKHLNARLWTGDKVLISGLVNSKFIAVLTTQEISSLLDSLEA